MSMEEDNTLRCLGAIECLLWLAFRRSLATAANPSRRPDRREGGAGPFNGSTWRLHANPYSYGLFSEDLMRIVLAHNICDGYPAAPCCPKLCWCGTKG